jgi:hypothetical protein
MRLGRGLEDGPLDHGLSFAGIPWLAAVPALGALAVTMISIFKEQRTRQFDFAASQGSVQPGMKQRKIFPCLRLLNQHQKVKTS